MGSKRNPKLKNCCPFVSDRVSSRVDSQVLRDLGSVETMQLRENLLELQ